MQNSSGRSNLPGWLVHCLILGALAIVFALIYFFWSPGAEVRDGRNDLNTNGIWMQHGWLGDDAWFKHNGKDPKRFRDKAILQKTAEDLKKAHIKDVFPHLCPASKSGSLPGADESQVERFLDAFDGFRVMPLVGGVASSDVFLHDIRWRRSFASSCAELLERHPRLAGIHVNIEPLRSGNRDFLQLLQEIRQQIPKDKLLSVAAYPPPSLWQQNADVHWDEAYSRMVASAVDQSVVMLYDTSLHSPGLYEQQVKDWTTNVLDWYNPKEVLLGVPAYDDPGVGYHDPATENLHHALRGINAALNANKPSSYQGICVYSDWQMTPAKWADYFNMFVSHAQEK